MANETPPIKEDREKREEDFKKVTELKVNDFIEITDGNPASWKTMFYQYLHENNLFHSTKFAKRRIDEFSFKMWRVK